MAVKGYKFSTVDGQRIGGRAIGFLEEILDAEKGTLLLGAKAKFDSLPLPKERDVRKRFDLWLDYGRNDNWFHGWPNDVPVKECFTFRWEEKGRKCHRLYGFLCNPQPKTNPSRRICVLAYHDIKNDWNTDRSILIDLMSLRASSVVRAAIAFVFPDEPVKGQIQ